jgi:HD-GYP domain-containing protein (c-di-GMP phosphodiesterase class II)
VDPVERLARARRRSHRATVRALAAVVDARDPATKHHSENVAELAMSLAQVLGLTESQVRIVELASQMHDVGKIGIRDDVLLKPSALTAEERVHVEEHPTLGERILMPAQLDEILPAVRHHHERWDGTGYPDRLRGIEIPIEARLLSVCDAFEAMTTTRTYRVGLSLEEAVAEIEACAGTQFDPDVAAAFARMVTKLQGPVAGDTAAVVLETL